MIVKETKYEVRVYPSPTEFSRPVGFKGRLLEGKQATRVVRRLRKAGVDAIRVKQVIHTHR